MSARKDSHVNAMAVPVRIHGADMTANARATFCTLRERTHVSVSTSSQE